MPSSNKVLRLFFFVIVLAVGVVVLAVGRVIVVIVAVASGRDDCPCASEHQFMRYLSLALPFDCLRRRTASTDLAVLEPISVLLRHYCALRAQDGNSKMAVFILGCWGTKGLIPGTWNR